MAKNRLKKKNGSWNRFTQECIFNCKGDAVCLMCRDFISCKSGRWISLWKPKELWNKRELHFSENKILQASHILAYGDCPLIVPEQILEVYLKRVFNGVGFLKPKVKGRLKRRFLVYKNSPISLTLYGSYEGIVIRFSYKHRRKSWVTQPEMLESTIRELLDNGSIWLNKGYGGLR